MEDENDEEGERDDQGAPDGLSAQEVLKEAFDHLTEEIKQFAANQCVRQPEHEQPTSSTTSSTSGQHRRREEADVKPSQRDVAAELLEIIQRSQQHIKPENFDFFDMFIIVPKFICLGWYYNGIFLTKNIIEMFPERQTVDRFQSAINQILKNENFLQDLQTEESSRDVESRVLKNVAGQKQNRKFEEWKQRIVGEQKTLFYIVHDEGGFD